MRSRSLAAWALFVLPMFGCGEEVEAEVPERRAAEYRSERVDVEMDRASEVVRTRGFTDQGVVWRGFLVDRGAATDQVSLRSGNCYVVLGVASSAVESLELSLFDSDGAAVARNTPGTPALHYCPPGSGTFFVAVRASGSGLFAVRRFEGPAGIDVRLDDLAPSPSERP